MRLMNVLLENHIVKARKSGRWVFYRVDSDALRMLISYLTKLLAKADDTLSESSHEEEVPARREKRDIGVPSRGRVGGQFNRVVIRVQ